MNRREKSSLLLTDSIETFLRRCFCFVMNKHVTHIAHSFLMSKFSVNMRCTEHFEMPTMSSSSRTFSRWLSNSILWIFFTISVVVTSFSRPLRCSSWQLVQSRFNSATQYFIVANEGADFPRVASSLALILVGLRPFNNSTVKTRLLQGSEMSETRLFQDKRGSH